MVAFKKERKMKVYAQSGYRYKEVPTIIFKGAYLDALGFSAGTPMMVDCKNGKLTITIAEKLWLKCKCRLIFGVHATII